MNISIALATWNGERFLRDQLDSLAAQTFLPHEVVVSDDGSTDETLAILEDFTATAPFPVTVRANQKRLGYAENFLQAAAMCSGDYIAFCDQDDVWLERKLARSKEALQASGAGLLIHRNIVATEGLIPTRRRIPSFRRSFTAAPLRVDVWKPVPGNAMVVSGAVLKLDFSHRPRGRSRSGAPMTHDEWTYFIATAIGSTHFLSEALVYYRQHAANVFGTPSLPSLGRTIEPAPADYRFLAERAMERAAFLEEFAISSSFARDSFKAAAGHYRALAGRLEARAAVYSPRAGSARRLGRVALLAAKRGYRSRTRGGLGLRSFFKDAIRSPLPLSARRNDVEPLTPSSVGESRKPDSGQT